MRTWSRSGAARPGCASRTTGPSSRSWISRWPPRAWIDDIVTGNTLSDSCPGPWRRWAAGRHYEALTATRIEYRSKAEQLPADSAGREILGCIYAHFAARPVGFERFAAHVWQMADGHVGSYEVTRASVDGGRDAVGEYRIGPPSDPVMVTFALEAKLYDPAGSGLGVKEAARLIARLRYRQFGVLVTTAHLGRQAYQEIRRRPASRRDPRGQRSSSRCSARRATPRRTR